jgi:hypothetical protein
MEETRNDIKWLMKLFTEESEVSDAPPSLITKKSVEGTLWPYIDMRNIYIMEKMGPGGSMS